MREIVRIGEPETVIEWRDRWRDRSLELLRLGRPRRRARRRLRPLLRPPGRLLARSQRAQELKFELLVPIAGDDEPTAVASFNYHQDHFSSVYGIDDAEETTAHTACLGFGLERITLALLRAHGLDLDAWPAAVREKLAL